MGRLYTVPLEKASITASVSDLCGYVSAANKFARIIRFSVDECDNPSLVATAYDLDLRLAFYTATVTGGTGFASQTPVKVDNGDASASGSGIVGPTTALATSSGSITMVFPKSCHIFQGCDILLPRPIPVINGQGVMLQIATALPLATKISACLWVEEEG